MHEGIRRLRALLRRGDEPAPAGARISLALLTAVGASIPSSEQPPTTVSLQSPVPQTTFHLRPFRNNLEKGDQVLHVPTGRRGIVAGKPRPDTKRRTYVLFDGMKAPLPLDVLDLRFIVDGTPEEVPPIDGEIADAPPLEPAVIFSRRSPANRSSDDGEKLNPVENMRQLRAKNAEEIEQLTAKFKALKAENERLDQAITILEGKGRS